MASYNSSIGKWRPYIIKPIKCDIDVQTTGNWSAGSVDFEARANNDSKVSVMYEVDFTGSGGADQYKWRYSTDNGSSWSGWRYADNSSVLFSIPCSDQTSPSLPGKWTSLDDGVVIKFSSIDGFSDDEVVRFTTPDAETYKKNRHYINGYATTLDLSFLATGDFSSYTDPIPLNGEFYTICTNYSYCTRDSLTNLDGSPPHPNFRLTVFLDAIPSGDTSKAVTLLKPADDYDFRYVDGDGDGTKDDVLLITTFDKTDTDAGGHANEYRIRAGVEDKTYDEATYIYYHYMDIAVIKNY